MYFSPGNRKLDVFSAEKMYAFLCVDIQRRPYFSLELLFPIYMYMCQRRKLLSAVYLENIILNLYRINRFFIKIRENYFRPRLNDGIMIRDDKSEIDELYTSVSGRDAEVYNNGHLDANRLCPELKPNVDNAAFEPKGMYGKLNDQLFREGGH